MAMGYGKYILNGPDLCYSFNGVYDNDLTTTGLNGHDFSQMLYGHGFCIGWFNGHEFANV